MAIYLLQLPTTTGGVGKVDKTKARIVEADSIAIARRVATAQDHEDVSWVDATATEIVTPLAADLENFVYNVKVSGDPAVANSKDLFDVTVTGAGSSTNDSIGQLIAEALRGAAVEAAIADDGTVFTDETTPANQATVNDVNLLPAVPVNDDGFVFGMTNPFSRLLLNVTTAGVGTYAIAWQYWDGSAWANLSGVTDDTTGFTVAGINDVVWTQPTDWATSTINAQGPFYYVRANFTDTSLTTVPLAGQAWTGEGLRASYSSSPNILTVAAIADGIGDHSIAVTAKLPNAVGGLSDLIDTVVHGGIAAAALTVRIVPPTLTPAIMADL